MKKTLMITAIVAIVLIAGALVYYFVFFKPGIERDVIKLQEQKLELEQKEKQEKKAKCEECLKEAKKNYEARQDRWYDLNNKPKDSGMPKEAFELMWKTYQDEINNCYKQYGD